METTHAELPFVDDFGNRGLKFVARKVAGRPNSASRDPTVAAITRMTDLTGWLATQSRHGDSQCNFASVGVTSNDSAKPAVA